MNPHQNRVFHMFMYVRMQLCVRNLVAVHCKLIHFGSIQEGNPTSPVCSKLVLGEGCHIPGSFRHGNNPEIEEQLCGDKLLIYLQVWDRN